jgi:hypothetical protein
LSFSSVVVALNYFVEVVVGDLGDVGVTTDAVDEMV